MQPYIEGEGYFSFRVDDVIKGIEEVASKQNINLV